MINRYQIVVNPMDEKSRESKRGHCRNWTKIFDLHSAGNLLNLKLNHGENCGKHFSRQAHFSTHVFSHVFEVSKRAIQHDTSNWSITVDIFMHQDGCSAQASNPQGNFRCFFLVFQVLQDSTQVISFLPAQGDPLTLAVATATKVKTQKVHACRNYNVSSNEPLELVASVSVTVNNTRPLCDFLALSGLDGDWRHECAFELLILGIANHEVGYLSHNSTDVLCQSSPSVFGVRAARGSDY